MAAQSLHVKEPKGDVGRGNVVRLADVAASPSGPGEPAGGSASETGRAAWEAEVLADVGARQELLMGEPNSPDAVRIALHGSREALSLRLLSLGAKRSQDAEHLARLTAEAVAERLAPSAPELTADDKPIGPELAAEWRAAWRKDSATIATYTGTYFNHWRAHFGTLGAMLSADAWSKYIAGRLLKASGETVYKETGAGRVFLSWAKDAGYVTAIPDIPEVKKTDGTRDPNRKPEAIRLEPDQVERVLAHLPEWSKGRHGAERGRFLVRPFFEVMWETGLRRATLSSLSSPKHWRRGASKLAIEDDIDKARFGRSVPVSARVRAILDEYSPEAGPIFGKHDRRKHLRTAALAAGLDRYTAEHLSNHDFRHSRSQYEADSGIPLTAIAHLRGWKNTSMADRYIRTSEKRATEAIALLESRAVPAGAPLASSAPSEATTDSYDERGDRRGSNPRHLEPQSSALPAELRPPQKRATT